MVFIFILLLAYIYSQLHFTLGLTLVSYRYILRLISLLHVWIDGWHFLLFYNTIRYPRFLLLLNKWWYAWIISSHKWPVRMELLAKTLQCDDRDDPRAFLFNKLDSVQHKFENIQGKRGMGWVGNKNSIDLDCGCIKNINGYVSFTLAAWLIYTVFCLYEEKNIYIRTCSTIERAGICITISTTLNEFL